MRNHHWTQALSHLSIKAAMTVQHKVRRILKLPGGEIAQPKHKPVKYQKAQVTKKIEGEYCMGTQIAPLEYSREKMQVVEKKETMYGQKFSLMYIR